MTEKDYKLGTLCVQGIYNPEEGESRVPPLVQSTTFQYNSAEVVGDLFDLKRTGYFYSRLANPTVDQLAGKIAKLEGGIGAAMTSSGQAASFTAITNICSAGDNIIALNNIYGGTFTLLKASLKRFGITTHFVGLDELEQIPLIADENTRLVFGETLSNPNVEVLDIEKAAELAHKVGLPLFIDNTFPTPILCRPFEHGADVVVHSASKYLDGHARSLGGVIVDSGNFDWNQDRFPLLKEEDPNYHGLSYTETFGPAAYLVRITAVMLRDFGPTLSPFNAWEINLGMETLELRMEKHSANALKVAQFLEGHDKVEQVSYPGLKDDPYHELSKKYLPKGSSGVISFRYKGGLEETRDFIDSLELCSMVIHVADVRTSVLHPASMTHRQLTEEDQKAVGILPNTVRLSVGIENADDIIEDLKQALER